MICKRQQRRENFLQITLKNVDLYADVKKLQARD